MKIRHLLVELFSVLVFALISLNSTSAFAAVDETHPGFKVKGRFLYDVNDEKTLLYGINKMIVWTDKDGTAEELDTAITNCRAEHMIPIVELHDATGEFDKLPSLVDWWTSPEVVNVIKKTSRILAYKYR